MMAIKDWPVGRRKAGGHQEADCCLPRIAPNLPKRRVDTGFGSGRSGAS
jgi:hypothetical protein